MSGTGTSGGDTSGGDASAGDIKFDVAVGFDWAGGGDGAGGCKKIDFLFVIDNSISMGGYQQSLIASFPGFVQGIVDVVDVQDIQVLVTDTDWNGGSNYGDVSPAVCDNLCKGKTNGSCADRPCGNVTCDGTLGAGLLSSKDGADCGVVGGRRFISQEQPDLAKTFACLAEVGTKGSSSEMTMQAAIRAVREEVEPGACNEGFLRDDAILVVTLISDEPHSFDFPTGGPTDWAQVFIDAKGGDAEAIVALAVVNDKDLPGGVCQPGGVFSGAPKYRAWAEAFPHGQWGSVCAQDYGPFFQDAVSKIDSACDGFVPPG